MGSVAHTSGEIISHFVMLTMNWFISVTGKHTGTLMSRDLKARTKTRITTLPHYSLKQRKHCCMVGLNY